MVESFVILFERISVAGLVPEVSPTDIGLSNKMFNVQRLPESLNIVYSVFDSSIISPGRPNIFRIIQARNTNDGITKEFLINVIKTSENQLNIFVSGDRSFFDIHFYISVQTGRVYYHVKIYGGYFFVIGSNVKVVKATLPEDAVEVGTST